MKLFSLSLSPGLFVCWRVIGYVMPNQVYALDTLTTSGFGDVTVYTRRKNERVGERIKICRVSLFSDYEHPP